jgi:glycosyltransferase involved in cell wall biosynthesis
MSIAGRAKLWHPRRKLPAKGIMDVLILGTRGIPGHHGGFETFAEDLAKYLTAHGHRVTVYCQLSHTHEPREDEWNGIHRVHIFGSAGPLGTIRFDLAAVLDSLRKPGVVLVLGYNTAVFSLLYRLCRRISIMNMDGIEWKRRKWSRFQRLWLRINEYAGAKLSNHLIADHPEIGHHLQRHVPANKITVIPYGADPVVLAEVQHRESEAFLRRFCIEPNMYAIVIARPEPENSLLTIVEAFSTRKRGVKLVVLGDLHPDQNSFHYQVIQHASSEVIFLGAIYDKPCVMALRYFARVYLHGHQVGGTNPSLVEALAAGNAVVAHDNIFNRWVAGRGAVYFRETNDLGILFDQLLEDSERLALMRQWSLERHLAKFEQSRILAIYESLLQRFA